MKTGRRSWLGWFLRFGLSAGLLLWLLSRLELKAVLQVFQQLPLLIWATAALLYLAAQFLSSIRWWILARTFSFSGAWKTYLYRYMVGMYFNLFLPTGVGGDVYKAHLLSKGNGSKMSAAFSVLGDRSFGFCAMIILGAAAVRIDPTLLPDCFDHLLSLLGVVVVGLLAALPLALRSAERRLKIGPRLAGWVLLCRRPGVFGSALALSFCLQVLGIGVVALLGGGIGLRIPLLFYFAYVPLVTILTFIPVSFNGIGIREGGFVYFLGLRGVQAETAIGLGLLFFSVQVAASLMGGVIYALGIHSGAPDTGNAG